MMKGAVIKGAGKLEVISLEKPECKPGYVVIKVTYAGMCASDILYWKRGFTKDIVLGHEFVGVIDDPGDSSFKTGDRVTAIEFAPCCECIRCRTGMENLCFEAMRNTLGISQNGTYAEYLTVREDLVRRIPDNVSDKHAAMIEPASVALHALNIGGVESGSKVLVTGAGAMGLMGAACAKAMGAELVVTMASNPARLETAEKLGMTDIIIDGKQPDAKEKLMVLTEDGFTHVLECSSAGYMVKLASEVLGPGGKLLMVEAHGAEYPLPVLETCEKELSILGSIFFNISDFELVIELMAEEKINIEPLAAKVIALEQAEAYMDLQSSGHSPEVKVLIDPTL